MIPFDLTDLVNRPNTGANILGMGCLSGFTPASMFNPRRQGALPQQYSKGAFVFEAEPGEGWDTDIRFSSEKEAVTDLEEMVGWLTTCRRDKVQTDPITAYVLPIEWHAFNTAKADKVKIDALDTATDFIAKRVLPHVDGFMVDAHCFAQIPFDAWRASVTHRYLKAASYGKPVDLVWDMAWHPASKPITMARQPLSEIDAIARLRVLLSLKPRGIFLMGGYKIIDGRFMRLPMAVFPALPAICTLLTGKGG